jgi:formate-dependent nitrite reductase membrane component NrfD
MPRGQKAEQAMVPEAEFRSYYDRPVLKEPVWTWYVPAYFFAGGLAAGSSMLAAGADLLGRPDIARRARLASVTSIGVGAVLLVADLGRPARFHHMLRVAKVTSPMSVGSWVLTLFGPAAGVAAITDVLGIFPRIGRAAGLAAAALGPLLASYTGVLLADTAVPAWHEAGRELPFLFVGGATAATGALGVMLAPVDDAAPVRRLALVGAALEMSAARAMERNLPEDAARPYRAGRTGRVTKAAFALTAAGAAIVGTWARRRRAGALVGGGLVMAGALVERFAVVDAGRLSARDPGATIVPQRQRVAARDEQ